MWCGHEPRCKREKIRGAGCRMIGGWGQGAIWLRSLDYYMVCGADASFVANDRLNASSSIITRIVGELRSASRALIRGLSYGRELEDIKVRICLHLYVIANLLASLQRHSEPNHLPPQPSPSVLVLHMKQIFMIWGFVDGFLSLVVDRMTPMEGAWGAVSGKLSTIHNSVFTKSHRYLISVCLCDNIRPPSTSKSESYHWCSADPRSYHIPQLQYLQVIERTKTDWQSRPI